MVGVHPKAAVEATSGYRSLRSLEAWNGKIYAAYGNDHMGPISIMPFDPVAGTFSNEYTAITESIAYFRPLMGRLYTITYNAIHYFRPTTFTYGEADQPWTEENMLNTSYSADMGCYNGTELWILSNNHDKGTLWRSKDGGVTWATERANAWDAYSYNSDLGIANGKVYYSTSTASSWMYDGTTWSLTPAPLGYMRRPVGFGGRLVYQTGSPGSSSSYLKSFDGTRVTTNGPGLIYNFYTTGDKIYALNSTNSMVYLSTNLTNWTYIATAPASARSLTVLNGKLYVGTTASEILEYSDPVSALPTVLLKATDGDMSEGSPTNTGTFNVSRSGPTDAPLVVKYAVKGTAVNGTDYTTLPGQITIPAGTSAVAIVVTPRNDGVAGETNETVLLELAVSDQYEIGRPCDAVGIIYEKNGVTIQAIDPEGAEQGADPIVFRISRKGSIAAALTVKYTLPTIFYMNGGGKFGVASNGVDYTTLSGSVVIPANAAYVDLVVTPIDDTLYEADEGILIQLVADAAAYVREIPAEARARIHDNEPPPNRNLVLNPSFEDDVVAPIGQPDSWGGAHSGSVARDLSVSHSGQASMRVNGPTPNLSYDYALQNIALTPGKTYIVRGWIKTPGTPLETGRGPCLHYVQISPSGGGEWYTETVRECGDWKEVSMTMTMPTNHVTGRLDLFWVANEATLPSGWFDDVSVTEQLPNSAVPAVELTSPTNGAVFTAPASVAISATASDSDGAVAKVEFFRDGAIKVGEDATAPYTASWNNVSAGTYQVTARATDNSGAMGISTAATITVVAPAGNHPPVANNQSVTNNEDTAKAITVAATDADGDPLTYSLVATPTHGTLSGTLPNQTYTPAANYFGPDSFTFKANDGKEDGNAATVSITVNPVNDAPVDLGRTNTVNEDSYTYVYLYASDVENDPLTYSIVAQPAHGTLGPITAYPTYAYVVYTPASNYYGPDSFTYRTYDGQAYGNTAAITITVNSVNDGPVVIITRPLAGAAFDALATVPITATATDVDGAIVKVEFYQGAALLGTDTNSPYGIVWSNVVAGSYNLTARATDNSGGIVTNVGSGGTTIVTNPPAVSTSAVVSVSVLAPTSHGTPISWLQRHFPGMPDYEALDLLDADGDGMLTWQEYVAGTLPTNGVSVFALDTLPVDSGSPPALRWNSISGREYTVWTTTNLQAALVLLQSHIPWTQTVYTLPGLTTPAAFYRVQVQIGPAP